MTESKSFVFRFGDVEIREREFCLVKAGEVSPIEPKAFRVLLFLLHNPQKLITKEELLDAVWADAAVTESSLTRSIAKLRRVLGDDIREPRYIATVATVGYRFIGKVEVSEEPSGVRENTEEPPGLSGVGKKVRSRKQLWGWVLAGGGVFALCLAGAIWYLHRPLPPPRITQYTQITHDGLQKTLVGTDGSRLYFNWMSGPLAPAIHRSGRNLGRRDRTGPGCITEPIPAGRFAGWVQLSLVRTQDCGMCGSWEARLAIWEMPTRPFHPTGTPLPIPQEVASGSSTATGRELTSCLRWRQRQPHRLVS